VAEFVNDGGHVLTVGLEAPEANVVLPIRVDTEKKEHIASYFDAPGRESLFAGIGPADVHNRAPRVLPLVASGAKAIGDGIMAQVSGTNVVLSQLPPYAISRAQGALPSFVVSDEEAVDGKRSALVALGTASEAGMRLGQKVKEGKVGKTYTFAASMKPLNESIRVHLEIEGASSPRDRVAKGADVLLAADEWTELHVTFKVEKTFPQGWFAYLAGGRDGDQLRVDCFRITEGGYIPLRAQSQSRRGVPAAREIVFANASFETGTQPWAFTCDEQFNLRRTYRRFSFALARALANMGVAASTPLLDRFQLPLNPRKPEKRWLGAFYIDQPEEWDDPYRFFNW
jgi:hypothetical protein